DGGCWQALAVGRSPFVRQTVSTANGERPTSMHRRRTLRLCAPRSSILARHGALPHRPARAPAARGPARRRGQAASESSHTGAAARARPHPEPGGANHPLSQRERRLPAGRGAPRRTADLARYVREDPRQGHGGRMTRRVAIGLALLVFGVAGRGVAADPVVLEGTKTEWQNLYGAIVYAATATAHNTSDAPVRAVKVRLELFDKDGQPVAKREGYNLAAETLIDKPADIDKVKAIPSGGSDPVRLSLDKAESPRPFRTATLTV